MRESARRDLARLCCAEAEGALGYREDGEDAAEGGAFQALGRERGQRGGEEHPPVHLHHLVVPEAQPGCVGVEASRLNQCFSLFSPERRREAVSGLAHVDKKDCIFKSNSRSAHQADGL